MALEKFLEKLLRDYEIFNGRFYVCDLIVHITIELCGLSKEAKYVINNL